MFPTKDEITRILVENIVGKDKKFDDLQESWFTKHLIIALREAIWVLLLVAKSVYTNLTVKTATGDNLDDKGYDFGVDRKSAVKAIHTVTLHKSSAVSYDLKVPDNFLLSTTPVGNNPPIKFTVIPEQNLYIPKGESKIENVLVECLEYGVIGNVSDNAINLVSQAGFDYVTASKLYMAGSEKEKDESYRARILERKRNPSRAGVPSDWERWALEVKGVSVAKCFRCARGAGTADIVIWNENGEVAESGLVTECQKYLDEKYMPADLADGAVLVAAPEVVNINIIISNAVLKKGYTKEMVIPILENSFREYFKSEKAINGITIVDCIVCIRTAYDSKDIEKNPVIEDFILTYPDINTPLTARQSPVLKTLTLEVAGDE